MYLCVYTGFNESHCSCFMMIMIDLCLDAALSSESKTVIASQSPSDSEPKHSDVDFDWTRVKATFTMPEVFVHVYLHIYRW